MSHALSTITSMYEKVNLYDLFFWFLLFLFWTLSFRIWIEAPRIKNEMLAKAYSGRAVDTSCILSSLRPMWIEYEWFLNFVSSNWLHGKSWYDKDNIKITFPAGPVKGSSLAIACQHTAQMRLAAIHENGSKTFSRFLSAEGFLIFLGTIRLRRTVD